MNVSGCVSQNGGSEHSRVAVAAQGVYEESRDRGFVML
jgi:hypothetical protein